MKIFRGIENWQQVKNPIVTVGSYDGVHLAHRSIISLLNHYAEIEHGESMLVTFYPHPRLVLNCEDDFREKFML
ncbi:MAG: FAD synthetase, partial [Bacteroidales bacterium]|nr:FAD synthetase [Bacteroidales bacterium]